MTIPDLIGRRKYQAWYLSKVWAVVYVADAAKERDAMPAAERNALHNAVAKLQAIGPTLGYPHTSAVQGAQSLRELRPRAGRSPWRALYRQVGGTLVIGAVGPEAQHDLRGLRRACPLAEARLDGVTE